ncbi:hypothetical protein COCNU_scaffold024833G000040 [Cocos nucifera]|nr:hypothetical protein [Cocos nucifera]
MSERVAHDITILHEALNDFARLNSKLENRAQTADAWAEVIEEFLHAAEEQEKKYQENLAKLEAELEVTRNKSKNLGEEFKQLKVDFQKEMESVESALIEERSKGAELLEKLSATKEKLLAMESAVETRVREDVFQALVEFKEFKEYEEDLSINSMGAYQIEFYDCKKVVLWMHPKISLDGLMPKSLLDELREEEQTDTEEDHPPSS